MLLWLKKRECITPEPKEISRSPQRIVCSFWDCGNGKQFKANKEPKPKEGRLVEINREGGY